MSTKDLEKKERKDIVVIKKKGIIHKKNKAKKNETKTLETNTKKQIKKKRPAKQLFQEPSGL